MMEIAVTERWKRQRFSSLFTENKSKNQNCTVTHALQFFFGTIIPKKEYELTDDLRKIYTKYTIVSPGNIVLNGLNLNYDFVSQRIGLVKEQGIITSAYIALQPREGVNYEYYCYLFKAMDARKFFHGMGSGIRLTLSYDDLKNVLLPVPPREEQDQIVRFLDWKVSSINRLINIKRKEIKDLESMKQVTVSSAVTRGLNPNAPMKFSGVKWLGNIPVHWALLRGKNLYVKMQRPVSETDEVVTCFRDGTVTLRKNRRTTGFTESLKEIGYQGIRKGDLVIHVMDAFAGSIGVSDSDGKGTPVYSVCQSIRDCNNHYYALLLREMARTGYIQSLYRGIRERSSDFRFEVFAAQFYPVPPREEQDQIVRFLDSRMSDFNRLISLRKQQIEELEDLKTRLISDVVTGKIDVRDVKIPEFNMVEEDIEDEMLEDNDETDACEEVEENNE